MDFHLILTKIKRKLKHSIDGDKGYLKKYSTYAFDESSCKNYEQYEAVITRFYHVIEKGLSYENYRAGFGKTNIEKLINAMDSYCKAGFDSNTFFYRTALSCLQAYINRNKENNYIDEELNKKVLALIGSANDDGGSFWYTPTTEADVQKLPFDVFLKDRHSIRHFSEEPVKIEKIKAAVELAQHTPSACNRQGWSTRIVINKEAIETILNNQNGNAGFGQEFDKILVVTGDIRYFNKFRETYQVFIDGGMYAENILNALHFYHIGSIPLSASLSMEQEKNIRKAINMEDAEVFILIIGIGNYPEKLLTTKSVRHEARIKIIS